MASCQWVYTVYTACRCVCVSVQIAGFAHALGERCLSPRLCLMSCVHTCVCLCVCPSVPLPVWAAVFALHDWTLRSACLCECVGEIERGRACMYELLPPHSVQTIRPCLSDQWEEGEEQSNRYTTIVHHWRRKRNSPLPTHAHTLR